MARRWKPSQPGPHSVKRLMSGPRESVCAKPSTASAAETVRRVKPNIAHISVLHHVARELPVGDLGAVFVPFAALALHVALEDMRAEGGGHERVALEGVDRLGEGAGEVVYAVLYCARRRPWRRCSP